MKALTKKQSIILLHIRNNPKISFRKLAKVLGRGVGVGAAQAHVLALVSKGFLRSERKTEGSFVLV